MTKTDHTFIEIINDSTQKIILRTNRIEHPLSSGDAFCFNSTKYSIVSVHHIVTDYTKCFYHSVIYYLTFLERIE